MEGKKISNYEKYFAGLNFPEAPKIVCKPPGPTATKLLEQSEIFEASSPPDPSRPPRARATTVIDAAKGSTIKDVDGNVFIDLYAGISVSNIGHSNPVLLQALKDQAEKIMHTYMHSTPSRIQFQQRLSSIAPCGLKNNIKMLFGVGGGDAVEGAVKLAKFLTNQHTIIAFQGAYHGQGHGALALTSNIWWKKGVSPLMPDVHRVPYAYCYRCPFGKEYPDCDLQCVRYIEAHFKDPHMGLLEPAALIVEPFQGEGGYIVPPDKFLPELRRICTENNVLLIVDEIQTGFGRTGKMFACEYNNVTPDILLLSKAIAGGFPGFSVIATKKDLLEEVERGPYFHIGTFKANAVACAVANANIAYMEKYELPKRSAEMGNYILKELKDLQEESRIIGEVRGKGLFIGVEFVKDKETKEPAEELLPEITMELFQRGVIAISCGHFHNVIRLMPALTITRDLVDKSLEIFSDVIKDAEKKV